RETLLVAARQPCATERTVLAAPIGDGTPGTLALARSTPFSQDEHALLHGFGRLLDLVIRMLRSVATLEERNLLLERLTRIQRSISHRAPLQEVLDTITRGASELLGDSISGLRLVDERDPRYLTLASSHGVRPELLDGLRRGPVGEGAGGRAIAENRLVVIEHYDENADGLPAFVSDHLQTAMAAPVHEHGQVVGSLTVASYVVGRRYSAIEQAALLALAEHTSLALTDAKTVAALREAQQSRDLFLAMVSHELKTPLTVIMATLRTLEGRGSGLSPQRRADMLRVAWERGRDLERLINSLLQSARAELATTAQRVNLRGLVTGALDGFEHARRITVSEVPDVDVLVDPAAVRAVLGSLLQNAVVHSPEGSGILLDCADDDDVAQAVRNEGCQPSDLTPSELFRPFQRGGEARSSGVGLGLHIARQLAESLGGTVTAESDQGMVTFHLRFPYRVPAGGA
ncbi:MAG: GAF domain-containing protein, partial [Egibacteraceae bacterium]